MKHLLGPIALFLLAALTFLGCDSSDDDDSPTNNLCANVECEEGQTCDSLTGQCTLIQPVDDDDVDPLKPYREAAEAAAPTIAAEWLETNLAILASDEMEGRENLSPGGEKARDWIIGQLEEIGVKPYGREGWLQPFELGVNIVGRIPGDDPALAEEVVILSAHYDHLGIVGEEGAKCRDNDSGDLICNGAADNGAGTLVALAIAKAIIESDMATRRSILLIFWDAEEDGLKGSYHYTQNDPIVPLADTVAMFSLDNVGGEMFPGVEQSLVLGTEHATGLREIVKANNDFMNYQNLPVSLFFDGSEVGDRSDHYPFVLAEVPVLWYGSGSPPEYHTPQDEIDIVNFPKLTNIARHGLLTLADIANQDGRPDFVADPQPQIDDAAALISLGGILLADLDAVGLDPVEDKIYIDLLNGWMIDMNNYLDEPPDTEEEWETFDITIRTIMTLVYDFLLN